MKDISGRESSLKRATSKNFTVFLGGFIFIYIKKLIIATNILWRSRKHTCYVGQQSMFV